ncbi:MAG: PLP-dependent aminotransferase family protein [Acidimicrobiia bacterium]|nr:PLP-dependent aminotransferase family protein [Acidimicrobiia bacterium]
MGFDMTTAFRSDLPAPSGAWAAPPRFSFVGGHNDGDSIPFTGLAEAAVTAIRRDGRRLATYNLGGSPLGHQPLRDFIAGSLSTRAGLNCDLDEILVVSGSLQALDLVNAAMLTPGDVVLIEEATYGGMLSRLEAAGVEPIGIALDDHGLRIDHLDSVLDDLAARSIKPRYLYTIPTVQNPTGTVLPRERRQQLLDLARRYELPIFEDDCYADLTWGCDRPPSIRSLDDASGQVIYCGSFSKTIGPALRVGYLVADPPVIRQLLALKTDAGTGAIEQLALAEYAPSHFDAHVDALMAALQAKCDAMIDALRTEFGSSVDVRAPEGGIYVWVTFPEGIDTTSLVPAAAAAGVEYNPGAAWSVDDDYGARRLRLCFGHLDLDTIRAGVAALAEVFRAETDLPIGTSQ